MIIIIIIIFCSVIECELEITTFVGWTELFYHRPEGLNNTGGTILERETRLMEQRRASKKKPSQSVN